jgi:general L-amino acid transport system substrate-binding protein
MKVIYLAFALFMTWSPFSALAKDVTTKKFWAVVAGVQYYKGSLKSDPPLKLEVAAEEVAKALQISAKSLGFIDQEILVLNGNKGETNEPTKLNFLNSVSNFARKTAPNDALAVYFTGHGADGYLYSSGTNSDPGTQFLRITIPELNQAISQSRAGKNFIFLDTCRVRSNSTVGNQPSVKTSVLLDDNIAWFFSSKTPYPSHIDPDKSYGIFTKHLINGLKTNVADGFGDVGAGSSPVDGKTMDAELNAFLETIVPIDVSKLVSPQAKQDPVMKTTGNLVVYRDKQPLVSSIPSAGVKPSKKDVQLGSGLNKKAQLGNSTLMQRGKLHCGLYNKPGFGMFNEFGEPRGFDVDICKGTAAAIYGNSDKAKVIPLSNKTAFTSLHSGEIDIIARQTPWSPLNRGEGSRSTFFDYPATTFFDGPGFMVRGELELQSAAQLGDRSVCVTLGTLDDRAVSDYFQGNDIKVRFIVNNSRKEASDNFFNRKCDVMVSNITTLAAIRGAQKNPLDYAILPETVYLRPYGAAVRPGDSIMSNVVKLALYAVVKAEELGINSKNIHDNKNVVFDKIGSIGDIYKRMGLRDDWAFSVIRDVGNYQEIYERNLGRQSVFRLPRGQNALWENGGLLSSQLVVD